MHIEKDFHNIILHRQILLYIVISFTSLTVTPNVAILFKEKSMIVRESSQDPAMVCIQVCPGNQSRTVRDVMSATQDVRFEFITKPGSADGM